MQRIVPIEEIAEILEPLQETVSKPQFRQIERMVRGILLTEGRRTIEAIRRSLAEYVSKGSLNHFLAESQWDDEKVPRQVLDIVNRIPLVAPRTEGMLFADDTLTGEHYGQQIEGLAKYRDVTAPGVAYIYSHCLVNLHYAHELTRAEQRQSGQDAARVEYWLDYRLYRRQAELAERGLADAFRTKPQLLIEMLQAQDWAQLRVKKSPLTTTILRQPWWRPAQNSAYSGYPELARMTLRSGKANGYG